MKNIAWIGTGVMGRSMCLHLINKGYSLSIYNRTKSKAADLIEAGARWCDTPGEAAKGADAVFTIVGYRRMWKRSSWAREEFWRMLKQDLSLLI